MAEMGRIWLGNQTAFSAGVLEPFQYAVAHGFDAFEWFPDKRDSGQGWSAEDLSPSTRVGLRCLAERHAMRLSVHARWQANPLRREAQPLLRRDLELAQDIGASLLNLHLADEDGIDAFIQSVEFLFEATAARQMQLAFENCPHHPPEQFNALFKALRHAGCGSGNAGMCFDLGHANLCASTRNDYLGYLDRLDPEVPIVHLHLHENWGDADAHLALFTGPSALDPSGLRQFIRRLNARQFSGSIIFEQWPQPANLLEEAREKLLELIAEVEPP